MKSKNYLTGIANEFVDETPAGTDEFIDETPGGDSEFIDEPVGNRNDGSFLEEGETPKRTIGGTLADIPISVVKGTFGVVGAMTGAASFAVPWVREWLHKEGYDPKKAHASVEAAFSPAQQAANKKLEEAKGGMETAKTLIQNPSTIVHGVIQQIPNFATMAVMGSAFVAAGLKRLVAAPLAEGLITGGHVAEEITQERGDGTLGAKGRVAALAAGATTGLISLTGARVAHKFGFADINTWMIGQKIDPGKAMSRIASVIYGGVGEAFQEYTQEGQEAIWVNAALGRPLMENVSKQATMGGFIGGVAGGGINVMTGVGLNDPRRFDQPKPGTVPPADVSAKPGVNLDDVFETTTSEAGFSSGLSTDNNLEIAKRGAMDDAITKADGDLREQKAREQEGKEAEAAESNQEQQVQAEQSQAYQEELGQNQQFDKFVEKVQDPKQFMKVVGDVVHLNADERPTPFTKLAQQAHKILSIESEVNIKRNDELAYALVEHSRHTTDRYEKYITGTLAGKLLEQNTVARTQAEFKDEPGTDVHKPISGPVKKETSLEDAIGRPDGTYTPISGKVTREVTMEEVVGKRHGEELNREFKVEPGDLDVSKLRTVEPTIEGGTPVVGTETTETKSAEPVVTPKPEPVVQPKPKLDTPAEPKVVARKPKVAKPKATPKPVEVGDVRSDSIREVVSDMMDKSPEQKVFSIREIMDETGLNPREFREGMKLLRNDNKVQLHLGDPKTMTKEQLTKAFKDEGGNVFVDMSLTDRGKVRDKRAPETQGLEVAKELFDKKVSEQAELPKLKRLLRGKSQEAIAREVATETGWYRDKGGEWRDTTERGTTRDSFVGKQGASRADKESLDNLTTGSYFTDGEFAERVNQTQVDMTNDPEIGGSTFTSFGEDLAGTDNIAVSIFPELSRIISGKLSEKQLAKFKRDHAAVILKNPMLSFGTWYDKGSDKTYLDIVLRLPSELRDTAIALGKKYNQKAIFDLKTFTEIDTGGTGENLMKRIDRVLRDDELKVLLQDNGEVRKKIWQDTGWWEYMPDQWSLELDISKVDFKEGAIDDLLVTGKWGQLLKNVLDFPKLFKAYPALADCVVIADPRMGAVFYKHDPEFRGPAIRIDPDILKNGYKGRSALQILMHEIQHGIQYQEGYASGGSPRSFSILKSELIVDGKKDKDIPPPFYFVMMDQIRDLEGKTNAAQLWREFESKPILFSGELQNELRTTWTELIQTGWFGKNETAADYTKSIEMLKKNYIVSLRDLPYIKYLKLGGEIQSRLVEKRIDMSAKERKATPPWETLNEMLAAEGLLREGDRIEDIIDQPRKTGELATATESEGVQKIGEIRSEKDIGIVSVIARLQALAKKADRVIFVEKQSMLPESLHKSQVKEAIEATWDQENGKIYIVLENVRDADHAVKIWMHEQVGHKGITELFADQGVEFDEFLDFAYDTVKKSPALFKEVSELYHDSALSEVEQKRLIVEEVIARRAERLNPFARKHIFQKLLDFMNKWVRRVTGFKQEDINLTMKDIDMLLEAAKNKLIYGETRAWLEFKHSDKEYKDWAKEVLKKNPRAMNWYTTGTEGINSVLEKDSDLYKFILGITSAATDVKSNAVYAAQTYAFLAGKRNSPAGRYPSIVQKKIDRLKAGGKTFGKGVKVDEFVRGLLGDPNSTTNDRWMHFLLFGAHMLTPKDIGMIQSGKSGYAGEADLLSLFTTGENTAARHKMLDLSRQLTKETGHEWEPRQVQAALWMKVVSEANNIPLEGMKYDYAETFFKFRSPLLGRELGVDALTPWEYIQRILGDDIGRVKEIAGMGDIKYDPQSQLDEKYRAHLDKQGVKEVPGYGKEDIQKVRDKRSTKHEHLALREAPRGVKSHISGYMESAKEWFSEKIQGVKEGNWQEAMFDDLHRVKKYSGTAWKSFRLARGLPAMVGTLLMDGQIVWDSSANHVKLGKMDGGLLKVFHGMSPDLLADVKARLIAERVDDLQKAGTLDQAILDRIYGDDAKGNPVDPVAYTSKLLADTGYLQGDKRYDDVKDHLRRYNQEILNIAEKSGLISPEARKKFENYDYIPLNRIFPDDTDIGGSPLFGDTPTRVGNVKKLKGSAGYTIGDPIDNLARNYTYLLSQSLKNVAFKKLYNDGQSTGMLVHQKMSPAMYQRVKQTHDYITMKVGGKEQYVRVDDARLFHALAEMNDEVFTIKVLNLAKKALTWGVTIAPAFRIRNLLRDTGHTWILMGKVNPIGVTKAFVDVMRNHVDMKQMRAMGGASIGGFYNADNPAGMAKLIDKSSKFQGQGVKMWNLWERIGEASENANRLALFRALKAEGKTEFEAGFEAKDLLDFSAHGKSKFARFLTSTVPFLNARMQGLHKMGRQYKAGERLKITLRGAAVASASIALHLLNKAWQDDDDPWYDNLPDRERWLFWHFGKNIAIPKPFEVGAVFGELPTRLWDIGAETVTGNDTEALKEFSAFSAYTVTETLSLNPAGQLMVIGEQWANKDFYRGTSIIPQHMKRVAPQFQWDDRTSKTARAIGKQFNVSPKRIDHVVDKLFAYAGGMALFTSDHVLQPWLQYPQDPAYTSDSFYWLHGRIPRGKQRYIKQEQEFYDLFAEVDRAMATFNRLKKIDIPEARIWRKEHGDELRVHPRLSAVKDKLQALRNKEREIYASRDLDADEKRARLDELIDKRHAIIIRHLKRAKEYLADEDE